MSNVCLTIDVELTGVSEIGIEQKVLMWGLKPDTKPVIGNGL